jgi:hypothetical protein
MARWGEGARALSSHRNIKLVLEKLGGALGRLEARRKSNFALEYRIIAAGVSMTCAKLHGRRAEAVGSYLICAIDRDVGARIRDLYHYRAASKMRSLKIVNPRWPANAD